MCATLYLAAKFAFNYSHRTKALQHPFNRPLSMGPYLGVGGSAAHCGRSLFFLFNIVVLTTAAVKSKSRILIPFNCPRVTTSGVLT